jgi:putative Holliday junction resolvase
MVLGLDIGDRRVGLAIGHVTGTLAVPLGVLTRTTIENDVHFILEVAESRRADCIVAGIPFSLNGQIGHQAKKVQAFLRALGASTCIPVETVDERFSTAEAERLLRLGGSLPSQDRGKIDAASATIILQEYLDKIAPVTEKNSSSGLNK